MKREMIASHLQGPLRVAAKSGFLTRRIWAEFFGIGNRSWQFRRWKSLTDSGFFRSVPDYGFVDSVLTLSDAGKSLVTSMGTDPVYSPSAKNLWHDEELIRLALRLERQGWLSNWTTEQELKVSGRSEHFFRNQVRAAKIPDLVIEWSTPHGKILWAVELERSRKEFTRYYDMVGAYKGISQIDSVLVIAATSSIETNIKKAQAKMGYPQSQRPMLFASMDQIIQDPISCELRHSSNRMELGKLAKILTGKSATEPTHKAKRPRNNTGNNVSEENEVG